MAQASDGRDKISFIHSPVPVALGSGKNGVTLVVRVQKPLKPRSKQAWAFEVHAKLRVAPRDLLAVVVHDGLSPTAYAEVVCEAVDAGLPVYHENRSKTRIWPKNK